MKKDRMRLKIKLPKIINSWTYFLVMLFTFSLCSFLIYKGFNKEQGNKKQIELLEKELYEPKTITFSVVGKMENNRLATKIGNNRTIYSIKVSTTDYWNTNPGDKITRNINKENLLLTTDGGYSRVESEKAEIGSLKGEIYYIVVLFILIFYASIAICCLLDQREMFKDNMTILVILVWIWFLVIVGFIIRSFCIS